MDSDSGPPPRGGPFFLFTGAYEEQNFSVPLQLSEGNEEGVTTGRLHERLKGRAAPREAGQSGEPGEVIRSSVGVPQKTKDDPHRLLVEGRVPEAIGVGGGGHREPPEAGYLGVWHRDPSANTGRKNRLAFEEARYDLLARFNEPRLLEELAESPEEFRTLADIGRDQHH